MQRINDNSEGENNKAAGQNAASAEPEIEHASDEEVYKIMKRITTEDADLLRDLA